MFGQRHHSGCEGRWAVGRHGGSHGRGRHHGRGTGEGGIGFGGRHGRGGDEDGMRGRRMLAQGDLRLIALALIAEQPRHGYDIIKALEEKTGGWYSPSPGIVYPTLTYLEEASQLTSQADGAKRLYTITTEGRGYLDQHRAFTDALLQRLAAVGERAARSRESEEDRDGPRLPRLVRAAIDNLRDVAAERLSDDPDAEPKVVDVLARAAVELRRG